jgi:hypothetical protein
VVQNVHPQAVVQQKVVQQRVVVQNVHPQAVVQQKVLVQNAHPRRQVVNVRNGVLGSRTRISVR